MIETHLARTATQEDWAAAQAWRTDPWAVPRAEEGAAAVPPPGPRDRAWTLLRDADVVGVGGLFDLDRLAPRTARLSLVPAPGYRVGWWLEDYADAIVCDGLDLGLDRIVGACATDVAEVCEAWRVIVDRVTRRHGAPGLRRLASGGCRIDRADRSVMRWEWIRAAR